MARRVLTDPAAKQGRASRDKGHSYEREIAGRLREEVYDGDEKVKRGLGQARQSGEVSDVQTPDFWIECKRMKRVNIAKAMGQASEDVMKNSDAYRIPVVVSKSDHEPATVTMFLEDWLELVKLWVKR